jgi:DNA-binding response OmpR family regulator
MTESKKRILLVEDEPNLAFNLEFNLKAESFEVLHASDGHMAIEAYSHHGPFDLIVLDVMLPEVSGFEVAKFIRTRDDQTQILMLTALGQEEDRLRGFEAGVDDYITKPFNLKEFLLRVRRMIRRSQYFLRESHHPCVLRVGPFELDTELLQLTSPTGRHTLTALETDILKEFMSHPNRVLSREHLLETVWGMRGDIETRTVDNFIVRLRRYIEVNPSDPQYLKSIRGRGYRFMED